MNFSLPVSEILFLLPLLATQAGIIVSVRQRLGTRLHGTKAVLFWTIVVLLIVLCAAGLVLSLVHRYAAFFRPVRTAVMLWLLPSSPAFLLYVVYRRIENATLRRTVIPRRRQLLQAAGALAVTAPFAVEAWGTFVTRFDYRVQEVNLPIRDLHPDLAGLRVLQISDIHLSPYLSVRELAKVIDASNELRPNIAFMTGDLITSWGDPVDECINQLSRIRADAPLLGCLGNHEIYAQVERYTEVKAAAKGMTFLRNASRELHFGGGILNIAGIDYKPSSLRGRYLKHKKPTAVEGATNILLSHNPDVFTEAPEHGWNAMLAGHTHGGQITVEIVKQNANITRFFTRFVSGLYSERGSVCYVTRGIGTVGVPTRIGATPEITLLRLIRS